VNLPGQVKRKSRRNDSPKPFTYKPVTEKPVSFEFIPADNLILKEAISNLIDVLLHIQSDPHEAVQKINTVIYELARYHSIWSSEIFQGNGKSQVRAA